MRQRSFIPKEFPYENVPDLPRKAIDDLMQVRNVSEDKRSKYYQSFCEEYKLDLIKRREVQARNISNFHALVNRYCDSKDPNFKQQALSEIDVYVANDGFRMWKENGVLHFSCKHHDHLKLINEFNMSEVL